MGTQGGEVDVAACGGVLRREDVVPHGLLVEVGILGIGRAVAEHLAELQHVVGVARLGTVELVDVAVAVGDAEEVLAHAVAADADGAVLCYVSPEVLGCLAVGGRCRVLFVDALKTDILWNLRVSVLAVEECLVERLHIVDHVLVRVLLGSRQVLLVAKQLVSVEQ